MFVNSFWVFYLYKIFFKVAIDIDNETKEHNRFLESMVIEIKKIEFNKKN
jgi:hypothetical protein